MRRVMLSVALAASLLVTGCGGESRECVKSHPETYTYFVLVGKVMVPMSGTRWVCDEYAS